MRPDVPRAAALGALVALACGALAALTVLARGGELTDTDWRLIASIVAVLYCGSGVVAAAAVRGFRAFAALPALGAAALLVAIWNDGWSDWELVGKVVLTALVVALAVLLLASLRLLTVFTRRTVWAFYAAVSALIALTALVALVLLWSWNPGFFDGGPGENVANVAQRVLIALFALSVAGYLATPLLARVLPPTRVER